jgi:hypothetical protein
MVDYSYCTFEDGWLRTRGLHHHSFPLLLWDTLVQTGYGDEVPEYGGRLHEEHGLPHYEVYIDIQFHPMFPHGESCSRGAHRLVLKEPACHYGHVYLIVPDLGPLQPRVEH